MAISMRAFFAGAQLQQVGGRSSGASARAEARAQPVMASKKLNSYDDQWAKGIGSVGIFAEEREKSSVNIFKQVQKRKLLSSVEQAGLLTAAEKAGLSLSKIESMGLLSTAERLGLLTLAEDLLTTDPGKISSASLPLFVAAVGALVFIPQDNLVESILAYTIALGAGGVGVALFAGGFLVKALQEE